LLVLSRRRTERVIIGDADIVITVLEVRGEKVRLGFEARSSISIHREETFLRIEEERKESGPNGGAA
jgi:carbon storage regulator